MLNRKKLTKQLIATVLFLIAMGCVPSKEGDITAKVSEETIGRHMERLASDDFMGRKPFTEGEVKTVNYLKDEFSKLGLEPGNGDSYFQDVPMVEITGTPSKEMNISGDGEAFVLNYFEDFVAVSKKTDSVVRLENSELVFAGYGIVAPEYGWNDYEGIDWKGKTAVVLVNDPGFQSGDSTLFKGNEMTYYGRWTYKYEEAARQGADGVLIIHDTKPASYGWNVVQSGWSGGQLILESDMPMVDIQGWITGQSAAKLMDNTPLGGTNLRDVARTNTFKPVPLNLLTSLTVSNSIQRNVSKNVVALLPGTDRKEEYILYSAHWDHFGIGRPIDNDSIYNGAVDNASGTACLLAIAEAIKKAEHQRSIVFIAVTAEEQGLLGSAYYAEHPIYNPKKTVANINMDAFNSPGPMKDLTITGFGHSELDEYAEDAAKKQGRYIIPDPEPEKGYFFRSDHFNFAKIGIPALYADGSYEGFDIGIDSIQKIKDHYRMAIYHQPTDEYDPGKTNLKGIQFDAQLLFNIGLRLSNEGYFPKWYNTSEFSAARE